MMPDLIAFDVETGGTLVAIHPVLSIGAVTSWNGLEFHVLITPESQPGKVIDPEAAEVSGYTPEAWSQAGALPIREAMLLLAAWLNERLADHPHARGLCHGCFFDPAFIEEAFRVAAVSAPRMRWRCSLTLFQEMMDTGIIEMGSSSLDRLGHFAGLWTVRPAIHSALSDARACLASYRWLKTGLLSALKTAI